MARRREAWLARSGCVALIAALAGGCGGESGESGEPSPVATLAEAEATPRVQAATCQLHADCESQVCDVYANGGECIDPGRVLYVSSECAWPEPGSGTFEDPFCRIGDAVNATTTDRDVIRVMPGNYFPFSVSGRRVSIYGPAGEGGEAHVFEEDSGAARVIGGAMAMLDGLALGGPTHSGLICEASAAVVRRSSVGSDIGNGALRATGCELELDRVAVRTHLTAIVLTGSRFSITNTFAGESNERPTVVIDGSQGTFRFSTIGALQETPRGTIDCGSEGVSIHDSIVFGNGIFPETGSRFAGTCELDNVVVGDDPIPSPGAIPITPQLEDGYRLTLTRQNFACCIDHGGPGKFGRWDIEGTPRPQGARADLGAFEVVQD